MGSCCSRPLTGGETVEDAARMEAPAPEPDAPPDSSSATTVSSFSSLKKTDLSFFAASGPQGWAELPDGLLQSIVALISSFHDLVAFGATCHLWRDFICSHSSTFQPLLLHPNVHIKYPRFPSHARQYLLSGCTWKFTDPANPAASAHRSFSIGELNNMNFVGCSYGQLIFSDNEHCHLVDVFTGAKLVSPCLPTHFPVHIFYGSLSAPVASLDSDLLVGNGSSLFQWHVGSDSWVVHILDTGLSFLHTVTYKGKIFAIEFLGRLFTIDLSPRFTIQQVAVVFEEDMFRGLQFMLVKAWLVVYRDRLLMIKLAEVAGKIGSEIFQFSAFRLELSDTAANPARWVKVDRLDNCAIFISTDVRCPAWSCMNPERWGGKSNCIYYPSQRSEEPWSIIQLWKTPSDRLTNLELLDVGGRYCRLETSWVFPSLFLCSGK